MIFMTPQWTKDAIFYHIYPLGLCGAPTHNDFYQPATFCLERLYPWLDHIQSLGTNAIYLGPIFQSSSHGYDTVDYYQVDRRLGDNQAMQRFAQAVHGRGMRLVLDGVFNHVGREFWAFKDVLSLGENSAFRDWFHHLRFDERSPKGDPFNYDAWHGHYDLVKLNLTHPHVRAHLFDAVAMWVEQFSIDGLRLDAADSIDLNFLRALHDFIKNRHPDFWLMGEVVHGDYRDWANPQTLDSVTNYETYKGLYSSLLEGNYFEIAYALELHIGSNGIYLDLGLYNFVDNHDVDRVASKLKNPALLFPLYLLLFTMPGIPSVYYGSEWGIEGKKDKWTDAPLRPFLELHQMEAQAPQPDLIRVIQQLAALRKGSIALREGDYDQLLVANRQFAFSRQKDGSQVIVALNSAPQSVEIELNLSRESGELEDRLNAGGCFSVQRHRVKMKIPPMWGRILSFIP